jgi:histone-lysine N-methyltransferase SUV420H
MRIYLPDCPYEVSSTNRYTIYSHEAAITARAYIKKGQPVKYLSGIQVMITAKEDKELSKRKKDFSIVISSRNKCAALFMGPARFANHDCGANARLMITGQGGIEIVATQSIDIGDEITVSYADNYFGEDNCECLCKTCEDNAANGWAQGDGSGNVPLKKSIEDSVPEGYSLRRRRRDDSCASASRTPSVTPDIRPRIRKTKPKTLNGGPERESLCDSPAPHNLLREKRKREYESLQSPPITPAKRLKTLQYEVEPVPILGNLKRRSSDDATSSSASDSTSTDAAVMTDATTPDEIQGPVLQSPELTPVRTRIEALKQEDSDLSSLSDFSRTPSVPPVLGTGSLAQLDEILNASAANSNEAAPIAINGKVGELPSIDMVALPAPITVVSEEALPISVTSPEGVVGEPEQTATRGRPRGRGRPRKGEERKVAEQVDEPTQITKKRVPGDYTLTPTLLFAPNTAWIHCTVCNDAFIQQNAYYTRSSCPRCERHSKLYGYSWPKTEKEGPNDKEERILDHREIHRFLDTEEEAMIRGRKLPSAYAPPPSVARVSNGTPGKRGPGRPRKYPLPQPGLNDEYDQSDNESSASTRRTSRRRKLSLKTVTC